MRPKNGENAAEWGVATTVPQYMGRYMNSLLQEEMQLVEIGFKDMLREVVDVHTEEVHTECSLNLH
jgi:hypothetical protein